MTKFGYVPEVVVSEHPVPGILETSEADGEEIKLERANRDLMEKTVQNYLIFDTSTPFKVNCWSDEQSFHKSQDSYQSIFSLKVLHASISLE